ncbi:histidinol-phosphatase HisJ [Bacillus carboniphilus]|uniref:Histidinol-phosphatase n=1 Tax=Bacillus carboniphilus TaxID=86663 RepID=A0ABY9K0T3_9BACI|nr:histidinol-phosphatase HisJ [Bacillus carboniphilus]WLR44193.1 histidinol-phosphatase HisJ [Bacillus carboniphilus]
MKWDGHVHTPYCPHGSSDSIKKYVETAIKRGFTRLSFTEHAPLPKSFMDPTPHKDSSMNFVQLEKYLKELRQVKQRYKDDISIQIGLEVDYIEGFQKEITDFLNDYGPMLDDSILSVHFLKTHQKWLCIDYSREMFQEVINQLGGIEKVYERYYQVYLEAVESDLGFFKPKRMGHLTLVRKFNKKFPITTSYETKIIREIFKKMSSSQYQLDMNTAGTRKKDCGQIYPTETILQEAMQYKIPLIFGSDAHCANDVGADYQRVETFLNS